MDRRWTRLLVSDRLTIGGVRQIVVESQEHCIGIEEGNGKLLWSLPFKTPYTQNIVDACRCGGPDLIRRCFGSRRLPFECAKPATNGKL